MSDSARIQESGAGSQKRGARGWCRAFLLIVAFCPLVVAGCKSAGEHRRIADRTADSIIEQKQQEALGRTEPFSIERPADTLRRRLLLDQDLTYSDPASLGTRDLEAPQHWPKDDYLDESPVEDPMVPAEPLDETLHLTLLEALRVGAGNSREYQTRKEGVFISALNLDLERNQFRTQFFGTVEGSGTVDRGTGETAAGVGGTASTGFDRLFTTGAAITSRIGIDLIKLLTMDRGSSYGIFGDASISVPLLRGAGRHIVREPLTQAERDVIYTMWDFETFKQSFAVSLANNYFGVLQQLDQVQNAEASYERGQVSTRRSQRLFEEGRTSRLEVDQAAQQELRALERWISAREAYGRRLDAFKLQLGLPPDARIELDREELDRLQDVAERALPEAGQNMGQGDVQPVSLGQISGALGRGASGEQRGSLTRGETGVVEADARVEREEPDEPPAVSRWLDMQVEEAMRLALEYRLDLGIAQGEVVDAQRGVVVSADALRAGLTFQGSAGAGGRRVGLGAAGQPDAQLRPEHGVYTGSLLLDLPLERTAQRNFYRISLIRLEQATRAMQLTEDQIKLDVRNSLRNLLQASESVRIQAQAVEVAQRRVRGNTIAFEEGRVAIREMLDAEEALVGAQNAFTAALVNYRIGELELQRDLGLLHVDHEGLWREYAPEEMEVE